MIEPIVLPENIKMVEVSPRDGLQNETAQLTTTQKVTLINELTACGFKHIEVSSFVDTAVIPQLSDAESVFKQITQNKQVTYSALIANVHGLERALSCHVNHLALFTAASEPFCQKNIHCSIEASLHRFKMIIDQVQPYPITFRAYISCSFDCPFDGTIAPDKVVTLAQRLWQLGCTEIVLADTTGKGTPLQVQQLIQACQHHIPLENLAVHFHDTYARALANIRVALDLGITTIDASIAGLGGCPNAPGASGNVATEDVLYLLEGMQLKTGINRSKVMTLANRVKIWLHRKK